ncbi:hypothetical protein Syun_011715 [Stephania yunnanensis]|uniref:Uncharacterized protein n=1 Tax=Stephania yunnanensis TaxID=152371 RepID=A0AAP0PID0_9MAGN
MKVESAYNHHQQLDVRVYVTRDHAFGELRPELHSNACVDDSADLASAARTKEMGLWRLSEKATRETISFE